MAARSRGRSLAQRVRVARAGEQGRGPHQHVAVRVAGEVHAEERQARVGHRVDQRAHQLAALGLAAAGRRRGTARSAARRARRPSPPAGPTSRRRRTRRSGRASRRATWLQRAAARRPPTPRPPPPRWPRVTPALAAAAPPARAPRRGSRRCPCSASAARPRPRQCGSTLVQLVHGQPPQARHAVLAPAALELVEAGQLGLVARHDHLAAALREPLRAPRRTRTSPPRPPRTASP